jgi:hypothetical protein
VGDKIFAMDTAPYSIDWTTTFDALIFFNEDGTNKITFINLVDVATVYDDGVAIGTLVLKLRSTIDFATTPPTYSGTVWGYGTGALKGVHISRIDVGLVDPVNGIFLRNGTITGWPKYVANA